jgi:hypothetical protein
LKGGGGGGIAFLSSSSLLMVEEGMPPLREDTSFQALSPSGRDIEGGASGRSFFAAS